MIPVIDIFAGPGGLSEGFSAVGGRNGEKAFKIKLSIEKEKHALETLKLRTFFREFDKPPSTYYDFVRGRIPLATLYDRHPIKADIANSRVWCAELGSAKSAPLEEVRHRINESLDGWKNWVLIGGPPCQAYSVAGRSRNRGKKGGYDPGKDVRHNLYLEYLQIICDHWPAVFIMENVKGLLSATLDNQRIFTRIVEDLTNPKAAIKREGRTALAKQSHRYSIRSLVQPSILVNGDLRTSVIEAERYGIPQARHRVILMGIREDLGRVALKTLLPQAQVPLCKVIGRLPQVRSGLSKTEDNPRAWISLLKASSNQRWYGACARLPRGDELQTKLKQTLRDIVPPLHDRGLQFIAADGAPEVHSQWYVDPRLDGVSQHATRLHMSSDLYRYLYAACYAKVLGRSPTLGDFPADLLPQHENVSLALEEGGNFSDRFRVQVELRPATTVTSHISKDGHYYIHYDPMQCRSLTVREAARLQTFPDNYYFVGDRTPQYVQVGNAVPALLARQIGEIVFDVLTQTGMVR